MRRAAALACAAAAAAAPAKVPVDVIVESYCPCSGAWEYDFLTSVAPKVGDIVELRRWFDASANGSQHCCDPSTAGRPRSPLPALPKGADAVTCFHSEKECDANRLQRCVQAHSPAWPVWLNWSVCAMGDCAGRKEAAGCADQFRVGQPANAAAERACADRLPLSWAAVEACRGGAEGVALMQGDAGHDDAVGEVYGMQGLPVVHVGGDRVTVSKFWDCSSHSADYQARLIAAVCNASTAAVKPAACG